MCTATDNNKDMISPVQRPHEQKPLTIKDVSLLTTADVLIRIIRMKLPKLDQITIL